MGALCSIHEQIPIQARVKATLAPSPQRLHRSCQSTIVDSHQYPATNLKLKKSIIPLRIQPIPPWSESESHCDKQTSSETKIQPQTAKMAAVPKNLSETGRRDSNNSQKRAQLSHGRGGAGNMSVSTKDTEPINLETPTIKSEMYTTGRGGSGNMARNTDALEARRAQDVVAYVPFLTQCSVKQTLPPLSQIPLSRNKKMRDPHTFTHQKIQNDRHPNFNPQHAPPRIRQQHTRRPRGRRKRLQAIRRRPRDREEGQCQ